jgi:hypothetical protein
MADAGTSLPPCSLVIKTFIVNKSMVLYSGDWIYSVCSINLNTGDKYRHPPVSADSVSVVYHSPPKKLKKKNKEINGS